MCTLSWLPDPTGYWVFFNRDERRTRRPGRAPVPQRLGPVRLVAPADGDAGGTWIGVNQFAVTAALLNRYHDAPVERTPATISRGLLLHSLLDARSARRLIRRLVTTALDHYQPFTIAAIDRTRSVQLADWNGRELRLSSLTEPGLIRTSSGFDQRAAERARQARFDEIEAAGPRTARRLRALHRDHQPRKGPVSICMHRLDARTQSLTEIRVGEARASVRYWAGAPCRAEPSAPVRLALLPRG